MMRQQRKSECNKGGEPSSHIASANEVEKIMSQFKRYMVRQRYRISFPDGYSHEYDLVIGKITHVVEIGDTGDDSKHNPGHKSQLINDGIAKSHIEDYYLDRVKYVKINKGDSFYPDWVVSKLS